MKRHNKQKKLGQHFLTDHGVVERIVRESGIRDGDTVVEIGPGRGILTGGLLDAGARVFSVELDEELYSVLSREFDDKPGVTLFRHNALYFDYGSVPAPFHIVANLPYSVSVPLIKKFFDHLDIISSMTLMVQAEVGERICAAAGDPHYGTLSIFAEYRCERKVLFKVPPSAFRPRPAVDSAVIRLIPRSEQIVTVDDEEKFFQFLHLCFTHRRKTIRNNLRQYWNDLAEFEEALKAIGINPSARPEDISISQFAKIYEAWRGRQ